MIFVRNTGVILIEVKNSATPDNISKATNQLDKSSKLVNICCNAVWQDSGAALVKAIVVPGCDKESVQIGDAHHLYKDALLNVSKNTSNLNYCK